MSASKRAPSSQFYWRDWLVDPAVLAMSFDERGRYFQVLARTHQTDDPGVCSEEQVRTWAEYTKRGWAAHRAAFARAFKLQADGTWIQKRTVKERQAQRRRYLKSQKGGRQSAARPRDSRGRLAPRLDSNSGRGDGPPASSTASSTSEGRNPTPPFPKPAPPPSSGVRDRFAGADVRANGADKGIGASELVGDLVAGAVGRLKKAPALDATGFSDSLLDRLRLEYPEFDVFVVAAQVREEAKAGGVRSPEGLLVTRLRKLRADLAERRGAAGHRDS